MAFELPDLPYSHDALASSGMSEETMQFHHDLHHNAYITKANELVAGTDMEGKSLEELIKLVQSGLTSLESQRILAHDEAKRRWRDAARAGEPHRR